MNLQDYKILCVEDNLAIQQLIKKTLSKQFTIDTAETIIQGKKLLQQTPYSVLLIEQNLPDGNGVDWIGELHVNSPHTSCILLTCQKSEQLVRAAFQKGASNFITKDPDCAFLQILPEIILQALEKLQLQVEKEKNLESELKFCLHYIEPLAKRKNLRVNFVNQLDKYFKIVIDPDKFNQIAIHLLTNAIKYTETGEIKVVATNDHAWLNLTVQDTGIGIASDQFQAIFCPYTQLNVKKESGRNGSGLGLSITKQLVELHRGSITLQSEINKGTTFHVKLPIQSG
jgi:response regulator RpfG family c-di-GMP phosphodiesterase